MVKNSMGLPDCEAGSVGVLHGVPGETEGTSSPRGLEASPCVSSSQRPPVEVCASDRRAAALELIQFIVHISL